MNFSLDIVPRCWTPGHKDRAGKIFALDSHQIGTSDERLCYPFICDECQAFFSLLGIQFYFANRTVCPNTEWWEKYGLDAKLIADEKDLYRLYVERFLK